MANEFQATFSIENATQTENGLMSKEDKTKLDGLSGDVAIDLASQTSDGLMSKEDKKTLDMLSNHPDKMVNSEEGIHGLRYWDGKLQYWNGSVWTDITAEGSDSPYHTMGVKIDFSNSDPESCITYIDDAVSMTAGAKSWDDFFGYRPCLFKDGQVVGYINPENYSQLEDGTPIDITSGQDGDVMVEFPRRGLKIERSGDIVTIKMTDDPDSVEFDYYAHQRVQEKRDAFYLGAYKGSMLEDEKLYSLSGKKPTAPIGIDEARTAVQARGNGYELSGYYQLLYRQCMYLLKYKNLDSQAAVGRGYVDTNAQASNTGATNQKGLDYGETTGKEQMKLFGVEDVWGNIFEYIDGIQTNDTRDLFTSIGNFGSANDGYINHGDIGVDATCEGGYGSLPVGTSEIGFMPIQFEGSSTTYFCDSTVFQKKGVGRFGGHWRSGDAAGMFQLRIYAKDKMDPMIGTRIMYL